jgi:hypothetical protein
MGKEIAVNMILYYVFAGPVRTYTYAADLLHTVGMRYTAIYRTAAIVICTHSPYAVRIAYY